MATLDFNAWCTTTQLKEATVEALKKEDIDSEGALKLLTEKDVEELGLSVGQKRVLEAALKKLKLEEQAKTEPVDVTDPVTTKSLAKDSGLEEILKKIEGAGSLEDSLLILGSTDLFPGKMPAAENSSTLNSTLPRLDNDPHVFLGRHQKAIGTKQGEKPLLIPDFVTWELMTVARKSKRSETIQAGQKYFSVQQRQNLNWNKSPFLCGSPQTRELCISFLEKENCPRPLPTSRITWPTQSNSQSSSRVTLSPRHSCTIMSTVNCSASMDFAGGVIHSTFIPGFSLNVVLLY